MNREEIADLIVARLREGQEQFAAKFSASAMQTGYFVVDNLLPDELARRLFQVFPEPAALTFNSTLRERKYVTAQMDRHDPLLEEALFAFHDARVVQCVSEICRIERLEADDYLYAGGLSLMDGDCYLNPHVDNSHDKDMRRWRMLNLLYYVTPDWEEQYGGNLEIWPQGIGHEPRTIVSRFNRLVVMATHADSWHSVSPVVEKRRRCCISNYYFSPRPPRPDEVFHVTRFRARPGHPLTDLALRSDALLRSGIRKLKRRGVRKLTHVYEKTE